jgi:hypothetical protein
MNLASQRPVTAIGFEFRRELMQVGRMVVRGVFDF